MQKDYLYKRGILLTVLIFENSLLACGSSTLYTMESMRRVLFIEIKL